MEAEPRYDSRQQFAAKSTRTLEGVCDDLLAILGEVYSLPKFDILCEDEDQDIWCWGWSSGKSLGFKIDVVGRFVNAANWTWFWGAPDLANYRIALDWDSTRHREDEIRDVALVLTDVLGCPLIPVSKNSLC